MGFGMSGKFHPALSGTGDPIIEYRGLVSSMSRAISGPLCTLRVHYMLMWSSIVLQSIGHVPLFIVYVWVYAYVLCMCMYVCVCVCMGAYKCVDHVLDLPFSLET